jgi:signal peptidase I
VSKKTQERKPGHWAGWVVNVLLGLAIVLCAAALIPWALGLNRYVINGHSMEPTIPYGSVAFDESVPIADLAVGDVITFKPPPEYAVNQLVTHRIHAIGKTDTGERTFTTKGDNNSAPDPWTMTFDQDTQARVKFHVPYVGYLYIALNVWWVRMLVIVLPALAAAIWIGVILWRDAGREVEREKKRISAQPRSVG